MKTIVLYFAITIITIPTTFGQFTKRNHLGLSFSVGTDSRLTSLEYERFFGKHFSISPRTGIFHFQEMDEYGAVEHVSGLGIGCSARYHFGKKPVHGFFLGAGFEAYYYNYLVLVFLDSAFAPQLQAGFHLPIGKSNFFQPIIAAGILSKKSLTDDEIESHEMFFRIGISMGIKF